ncbi:alpha/beta hydrolase family protein [Pseudovibrio sp. SPO723]|uniref:alpha/beta hydrolase family protein n=1 Tax=Nesiotobacter zosterae TaxID=392721 RepID=UPI0029C2FED7|nr:dienelactone hydrolase family protein [Pseudovibrio sp. SPO723]MDX5593361.1 dienelactone hydrolase family protein [Pseudovibrio sp. SPO723]
MPKFLSIFPFLFSLIVAPELAGAQEGNFNAGVTRIMVQTDNEPLTALVWYPTEEHGEPWSLGPFQIAAVRDSAVSTREAFPLVVISHGRQSDPLAHRQLAASLARNGFVVVAPTHKGDAFGMPPQPLSEVFRQRPEEARSVISSMLADERFAPSIDPERVGMIGYSAGGYTALVLAGASPNFAAAAAYCAGEGTADVGSCGSDGWLMSADAQRALETWQPIADPRLKAVVLFDPHAMMFDGSGLARVQAPVLLYRPENDSLMPAQVNAELVSSSLGDLATAHTVPGRHFVFIDPCPPAIAAEAALICQDAPEVDRAALHRQIEAEVAAYLKQHL